MRALVAILAWHPPGSRPSASNSHVVRDLAAEPRPDTHAHVEYFDGYYYLAESEIGIVLQVIAWSWSSTSISS